MKETKSYERLVEEAEYMNMLHGDCLKTIERRGRIIRKLQTFSIGLLLILLAVILK